MLPWMPEKLNTLGKVAYQCLRNMVEKDIYGKYN